MDEWRQRFSQALHGVQTSPLENYQATINRVVSQCRKARGHGNRVFFIGNGGSAGIASHMAADWLKNGRFKAMCFNDGALMSCLENDLGHNFSFSEPIKIHVHPHDILFAISSSGKSNNILQAADEAARWKAEIVTLSGFDSDNPLRQRAGASAHFYVPSNEYGFVECVHQCILHEILDTVML